MVDAGLTAMGEPRMPNSEARYEVTPKDLPLHCPLPGTSLWNSHPRVYIPIQPGQERRCPYCGAVFVLVDERER